MSLRLPALRALLDRQTPRVVREVRWEWLGTPLPLRMSSHLSTATPPEELITSVRCLVRVDDAILACETPNGTHVMPFISALFGGAP